MRCLFCMEELHQKTIETRNHINADFTDTTMMNIKGWQGCPAYAYWHEHGRHAMSDGHWDWSHFYNNYFYPTFVSYKDIKDLL